ncbi:MAG: ribonuclease D [Ilumatobacteraceae bacterium]
MNSPDDVSWEWIDSDAALRAFVAWSTSHEEYRLDTEFHREKSYFPQLALIQVEVGDRLVLIDPLHCDAGLLEPLITGPALCVIHAAQQDLDVMSQSLGFVPSRIFDTQLAAGFVGHSTPSLSALVSAYLRVNLPKGDRLTDWLRRPLTRDQMRYAASDVVHLRQLREIIESELEALGRVSWAAEACEELRTRPTGPVAPADAWLRVKDVRTLKGRARWVAREVARWREERAMDLDRPVRHVLSDIALLGVAQRAPRSVEDLAQCRGVDAGFARSAQGRAVIDAVGAGVELGREGELSFPAPEGDDVDRSLRSAITLVSAWVSELARQSRLDPALLATRKDIVDLLARNAGARLARGWRAEILGRDIEDLVAGRKGLTFTGQGADPGLRLVDVPE